MQSRLFDPTFDLVAFAFLQPGLCDWKTCHPTIAFHPPGGGLQYCHRKARRLPDVPGHNNLSSWLAFAKDCLMECMTRGSLPGRLGGGKFSLRTPLLTTTARHVA